MFNAYNTKLERTLFVSQNTKLTFYNLVSILKNW